LSLSAARAAELQRERKTLTAQARLSALVVGAAPLLAVAVVLLGDRGSVFLDGGPAGAVIAGVGLTLVAAGLAVVVWMLRGAER
jgi:Flp pilus assembly protein TadB